MLVTCVHKLLIGMRYEIGMDPMLDIPKDRRPVRSVRLCVILAALAVILLLVSQHISS